MGFDVLQLEPAWDSAQVGDSVDLLASIVVWDSSGKKTLARTTLGQKLAVIQGQVPEAPALTVLDGSVVSKDRYVVVDASHATVTPLTFL